MIDAVNRKEEHHVLSTARHRDLVFGQHAGSDIDIDLTATNPPEIHFRYKKKKSHPRIYCRHVCEVVTTYDCRRVGWRYMKPRRGKNIAKRTENV